MYTYKKIIWLVFHIFQNYFYLNLNLTRVCLIFYDLVPLPLLTYMYISVEVLCWFMHLEITYIMTICVQV